MDVCAAVALHCLSSFDHARLCLRLSEVCSHSSWANIIPGFLGRLAPSGIIDSGSQEKITIEGETLLSRKASAPVKSIKQMLGKCISFICTLALRGAEFYIREMPSASGSAAGKQEAPLSPLLREELAFWRFLDSWTGHIPWRKEEHVALTLSTEDCAAVAHTGSHKFTFGDVWTGFSRWISTAQKCGLLSSLPAEIQDCRVNIQVDNQAIINTWHGRGPRSSDITRVAQRIFTMVTERSADLSLVYITYHLKWMQRIGSHTTIFSEGDPAVAEMLVNCTNWMWNLQSESGHTLDLVTLDRNVMRDKQGVTLKIFNPYPTQDLRV